MGNNALKPKKMTNILVNESQQSGKLRLYFLDNLRSLMIFLVVIYHSGGVYESSGLWGTFWLVDDDNTTNAVGIINIMLDVFIMSVMFFIAGFFTSRSLESKKIWLFIKAKINRLMLPWLISVFILLPLYKVIFLYSRELPQESWQSYFYFSNDFISQSWLWFLPILFCFDMFYLLLERMKIQLSNVPIKQAIIFSFIIGVIYSVLMSLLELRGWTKTSILDFQNERVLIYFMMFILGTIFFKQGVFSANPIQQKIYSWINYTYWLPLTVYISMIIYGFIMPNSFIISPVIDTIIKWICFHLTLYSVLFSLLNLYKIKFDKQRKLLKMLSKNSYYVYLIHVIVLGVIANVLLLVDLPSLVKYLILSIATYVVSNVLVTVYYTVKEKILSKNKCYSVVTS